MVDTYRMLVKGNSFDDLWTFFKAAKYANNCFDAAEFSCFFCFTDDTGAFLREDEAFVHDELEFSNFFWEFCEDEDGFEDSEDEEKREDCDDVEPAFFEEIFEVADSQIFEYEIENEEGKDAVINDDNCCMVGICNVMEEKFDDDNE